MPPFHNPPWVMFNARPGEVDILPAGRPGCVLQAVPAPLARVLVEAANNWASHKQPVIRDVEDGELDEVNPGIKKTVLWLRDLGFDTTDSGDGSTGDYACDLPFPYVNIAVKDPTMLVIETDRLRRELWNKGIEIKAISGDEDQPFIQMTYDPANRLGFIQLGNICDENLED